jgi:hypothetical protein
MKTRAVGATFYKGKGKYGGLEVSEVRRLKALDDENNKLKKLLGAAAPSEIPAGGEIQHIAHDANRERLAPRLFSPAPKGAGSAQNSPKRHKNKFH